jgi:hypothetical protein
MHGLARIADPSAWYMRAPHHDDLPCFFSFFCDLRALPLLLPDLLLLDGSCMRPPCCELDGTGRPVCSGLLCFSCGKLDIWPCLVGACRCVVDLACGATEVAAAGPVGVLRGGGGLLGETRE